MGMFPALLDEFEKYLDSIMSCYRTVPQRARQSAKDPAKGKTQARLTRSVKYGPSFFWQRKCRMVGQVIRQKSISRQLLHSKQNEQGPPASKAAEEDPIQGLGRISSEVPGYHRSSWPGQPLAHPLRIASIPISKSSRRTSVDRPDEGVIDTGRRSTREIFPAKCSIPWSIFQNTCDEILYPKI